MTAPVFGEQLKGRYDDDDRSITIEGGVNHEVTLRIENQEPMFLDGLDLLRLVSYVVLDLLYGPSSTAVEDALNGETNDG